MPANLEHIQQVYKEADCLYPHQQVYDALKSMAARISERLVDKNPLIYCIMNGGLVTMGHLLPLLNFPLQSGYLHATRYRMGTTGSELTWKVLPHEPLSDRCVLVVDDILDEGHTLMAVMEYCRQQGAKEVLSAILLDKQHNRKAAPNLQADFTALTIEDRYVFGFGLDYQGYWRNAPGIFALKQD